MKAYRFGVYLPGALALLLALPGWWLDAQLAWAAYLAAWWFCTGCVMGGLVNVWIHNLTGGEWGEVIREPLLSLTRALPLLVLLFVPLFFGMHALYPWLSDAGHDARWAGELTRPEFKRVWLTPTFFVVRSIVYLAIWLGLALVSQQQAWRRSRPWSAAALLIYAITATLAAVDWVMSLVPVWYSTNLGLLVLTGQGLAGLAFGVAVATVRGSPSRAVMGDLGNILLTYVLLWAYLAFTAYLIIWGGNLPDEIVWYVRRLHTGWWWIGLLLITCHFFIPLLVLLSRSAKMVNIALGALAAGLLLIHLVDAWWLTVPSVRPRSAHVFWLAPLAAAGFIALVAARVRGDLVGRAA
jgi:hypothetical protein